MKPRWVFALLPLLPACGSATSEVLFGDASPDAPMTPDAGKPPPTLVPPTELVARSAAAIGVTDTSWVIYRDATSLGAVPLVVGATSQVISEHPGATLIRGRVVFDFADVDWTTSLGNLSIWTAKHGSHVVGQSLYAEALIAASQDGATVVYTQNSSLVSADLVIAPSDLSSPVVLIPKMGRGSSATCNPSLGFVENSLFIAWCAVGSQSATLERYDRTGDGWSKTVLASDALSSWSSDRSGKRVFFQSKQYEGFILESGNKKLVDKGIGEALVLPDGSAVLYNVSDQYRRSSLPDVNPVPVVVSKYAARAALSRDHQWLLYSTTVTYDKGTRRDLLLADTSGYNATPNVLVANPVAGLGRSAFTRDGEWVLYFTYITPTGATLVARPVGGGAAKQVPNVVEVGAAHGSTIVLTTNQSDPDEYPVLADLQVMNLASDTEPKLLEAKTIDGRGFRLDDAGKLVVYTRSDPDAAGPKHESLFFQSVP